jgi:hypothetical protein
MIKINYLLDYRYRSIGLLLDIHGIDHLKPICDSSRGQGLTEFVLVIPIFFVLLLGVIQFSLLYFAFNIAHYASFAACRAAIVRPCSLFNPDQRNDPSFTPAVFSAAVLATMAAVPSQQILPAETPYPWMPALPDTQQVRGLDFTGLGTVPEIAMIKYTNATYLTAVQRVQITSDIATRPVVWEPCESPHPPCPACDTIGEPQHVPPPGDDISLEVTLLYPLIVPLVNRVIYGVFVNFTEISQELGLIPIFPPHPERVVPLPAQALAPIDDRVGHLRWTIFRIFNRFAFPTSGQLIIANELAGQLATRTWYILPVRARCTLTVEGSPQRLMGP